MDTYKIANIKRRVIMYKYLATARVSKLDSVLKHKISDKKLRESERERIMAAKKTNRAEKIKRTHHRKLWRTLLRDLIYEKNNVRMGMRYQTVQNLEARQFAFEAYLAVIGKVETLIQDHAESGITPSEYARQKNLPNNGLHWTDWVPAHIKTKIVNLFDEIPHTPRAKRKLPFPRTRRPDKGSPLVKRLRERTEKELEIELGELRADPTNAIRRRRVTQMREAFKIMDTLKPNDVIPYTWHGLFLQREKKC